MDGWQKKLFKCSWSFLLFSVGVCHAKGESLLSLFVCLFVFVHRTEEPQGSYLDSLLPNVEEMDWSF